MTRKEQINKAALDTTPEQLTPSHKSTFCMGYIAGAEWAFQHEKLVDNYMSHIKNLEAKLAIAVESLEKLSKEQEPALYRIEICGIAIEALEKIKGEK